MEEDPKKDNHLPCPEEGTDVPLTHRLASLCHVDPTRYHSMIQLFKQGG